MACFVLFDFYSSVLRPVFLYSKGHVTHSSQGSASKRSANREAQQHVGRDRRLFQNIDRDSRIGVCYPSNRGRAF